MLLVICWRRAGALWSSRIVLKQCFPFPLLQGPAIFCGGRLWCIFSGEGQDPGAALWSGREDVWPLPGQRPYLPFQNLVKQAVNNSSRSCPLEALQKAVFSLLPGVFGVVQEATAQLVNPLADILRAAQCLYTSLPKGVWLLLTH